MLLRHDVDLSPEAAYQMSVLEKSLGVRATYFIMLRSPAYNLFSRSNSDFIQGIIQNGHEIGLHYDQGLDHKRRFSNSITNKNILKEARILEKMFELDVTSMSFHQPSEAVLAGEIDTTPLLNSYGDELNKNFTYISDSNMTLDWSALDDLMKPKLSNGLVYKEDSKLNLQLLVHPVWWIMPGKHIFEKWNNAIIQNFQNEQKQFIETERAYGPQRQIKLL